MMSKNKNTLFWIITGAVIVISIFITVNAFNNGALKKATDKISSVYKNALSDIDEKELSNPINIQKYYEHNDNLDSLEVESTSLFEFDEETGTILKYNGTSSKIVIPFQINGVTVKKIGPIGKEIYNKNSDYRGCESLLKREERYPEDEKIKEQRSKYEEQLNSGSEYIEATVSGLVSYKIDGLEGVLTPNSFENITEEYLNSLKLKTGEMISSSNESGKIVNNYYCYLVGILKSEEAKNAKLNKSVQLLLSTGDEVKATIIHIAQQNSGNKLIVFKLTDCVEKLIAYRKITFEVVWWSANGLKVPNSAIAKKDGKDYIIRKRIGYTDDILIKVLKKSEDYSIIENYTSLELKELGYSTEEIKNMKNISLYDEILLNP